MNNPIGIYLHVPFCESKCAYCDFYSYRADVAVYDKFTDTLCEHLKLAGERINRSVDTIYLGGGTPSLLGGNRISRIIKAIKDAFILKNAEITVECNPADILKNDFELMADAGVNRISIGLQSAIDSELKNLSRRHTADDVIRTINDARLAGITNISVDLMLGIPNQTIDTLKQSIDFALSQNPNHISCYILKIEPDTPFGKVNISSLSLPDEDTVSDMYLYLSDYLKLNGFEHYEISNFAKKGFRAHHNVKYWNCEEYLGLGPAAYSYLNGRRFHFSRDINEYLNSPTVQYDEDGGDFSEYAMLRLRLSDGLDFNTVSKLFGANKSLELKQKAFLLKNSELLSLTDNNVSLTSKGFLLSNSVIEKLIF